MYVLGRHMEGTRCRLGSGALHNGRSCIYACVCCMCVFFVTNRDISIGP